MRYLLAVILVAGCGSDDTLPIVNTFAPVALPDLGPATVPDLDVPQPAPDMATISAPDLATRADMLDCVDSTTNPIKYPQCFDDSDCGSDTCHGAQKCGAAGSWHNGHCCTRWSEQAVDIWPCCAGLQRKRVKGMAYDQCL